MKFADVWGPEWLTVTLGETTVPLGTTGALSVRHGRQRVDDKPAASTVQVTMAADGLPRLPRIGDPFAVQLGPDAIAALGMTEAQAAKALARFAGDVTDAVDAPGAAGLVGGGFVTITAAGRRSRLGRIDVGDAPWPAELDGARAGRILAIAAPAAGLTVGDVDPGAYTVLARDVDRQKALGLLDKLADDTGGVLVQLRDGTLTWQDRNHRRLGPPIAVVLRAGNIIRGVTWQQSISGLVNDLTVAYGPDPQATVREVDDASVDRFGAMVASMATDLADEADATDLAHDLISRRSRPAWRIEALSVDLLRTVDEATTVQLLGLEVSDLLGITGFPESGPHVATRLFVEGWTETISAKGWRLALAVSDYGLSGESPRWVDVTPDLRWVDVDPDMTWLQAAGWSLAFAEGRWWDVPADQSWATVDPAMSWATYTIDAT